MSNDDKPRPSIPSFRTSGKAKSREETAAENKNNKENKKNVKEIVKTSRNALEEMTKNATEASERMENRINKMTSEITEDNKELKNTITELTGAIQLLVKNISTEPRTSRLEETTKPASNARKVDENNTKDTTEAENTSQMDTQSPPDSQTSQPATRKHESESQTSSWKLSSSDEPNTDKSTQESQSQSQLPPNQPLSPPSTQQEAQRIIHEQQMRLTMLEQRMKSLEQDVQTMKEKENQQTEPITQGTEDPAKQKRQPIKEFIPAPPIDAQGNIDSEITPKENQKYDWTKVKLPKRRWETRPSLSNTMENHVYEDLEKHIEDRYRGDNKPKTKGQKKMTEEQRQKIIDNMLDRAGFKLGISPMTAEHMARVDKLLANKGIFEHDDTPATRKKKTIKAIIKSWVIRNLKMTTEEWESIEIEDISVTDNSDIVFLQFKTKDDVSKLTSKARLLPQDQGKDTPRLVMYVDSRAMKRHKAILSIARTIREHSNNTTQTTVRTGRHDFLLRTRPKGSTTPWSEIPPIHINQDIPEFEVGTYWDMVNPHNNPQQPEDLEVEHVEEMEDIELIAQDISRQNSEQNTKKRERTMDSSNHEREKNSRKADTTISNSSPEPSGDEEDDGEEGDESDDDPTPKPILNSTPISTSPPYRKSKSSIQPKNNYKMITHYNSVKTVEETPINKLQHNKIQRQQSIPETPDQEEKAQQTSHEPIQRKTLVQLPPRNTQFDDDEVIADLTTTRKTNTTQNE